MKWNNFITQAEIYQMIEEVRGDTLRWFLHPFIITHRFEGEGRERDMFIVIKPIYRPLIACLS